MTLNAYINDTAQLLNDANLSFISQAQLIRWINNARKELAERSGCIRRLVTGQSAFGASAQPNFAIPNAAQPSMIPGGFPMVGSSFNVSSGNFNFPNFNFPNFNVTGYFSGANGGVVGAIQNACMTIPGVERYPYEGFFNPFLRQTYAGCDYILDTIACSVNWGGVNRPSLDWMPWDDLQAYARAYAVLNTSYPSVWSVYNDGQMGEIFMFPIPSQAGEIDLDVFAAPIDLYSDSDPEAIPRGFQRAVKYAAAKMAMMSTSRYAQADMFEDEFARAAQITRTSVDRGKTSSYYYRVP